MLIYHDIRGVSPTITQLFKSHWFIIEINQQKGPPELVQGLGVDESLFIMCENIFKERPKAVDPGGGI